MKAVDLLQKIFSQKKVWDAEGKDFPLKANISRLEGAFLQDLIHTYPVENSIEIGLAYGVSALYICEALQAKKLSNPRHTLVDPHQDIHWNNIGLLNLDRAGVDFYHHIPLASEFALPQLLAQNQVYDFGLIDGWHTFDHSLLDFFYLNRMLKVGGILVFDDVSYPSVHKLLAYITQYPHYKVIAWTPKLGVAKKGRLERGLQLLSKLFPPSLQKPIFHPDIFASPKAFPEQVSMLALQKIGEDERSWTWFENF